MSRIHTPDIDRVPTLGKTIEHYLRIRSEPTITGTSTIDTLAEYIDGELDRVRSETAEAEPSPGDATEAPGVPAPETAAKVALTIGATGAIRTETLQAFTEDEYRKIIASLP